MVRGQGSHWLIESPTILLSMYSLPLSELNLGKRAFSVAVPRVWNELPITLKTSETIAIFRKLLLLLDICQIYL